MVFLVLFSLNLGNLHCSIVSGIMLRVGNDDLMYNMGLQPVSEFLQVCFDSTVHYERYVM